MFGVSEVIAIILILMITISLAGLAYMFMSTTMSDVTASAGSTVDTTTTSMLTSFAIESIDIAKVYVRNTGQNSLTSLSVYVNDELATFNATTPIAAGAVGTVTIYSFIPDGATVKVTSPSGFSTSKIARPCERAVGCWKFDEGTGNVTYDSSTYDNTGTLFNGPTWINGKYNGALLFDGSNDYVNTTDSSSVSLASIYANGITFSALIKTNSSAPGGIAGIDDQTGCSYFCLGGIFVNYVTSKATIIFYNNTVYTAATSTMSVNDNNWHYIVGIYNSSNYTQLYVDGVYQASAYVGIIYSGHTPNDFIIGQHDIKSGSNNFFNGTIDEVRIYNRAIY